MQDFRTLGICGVCLLIFFACSAPEPKKVSSTKDEDAGSGECVVATEDDKAADEESEPIEDDTDTSLRLLQEVTYEKDIKPIVIASCAVAGCHVAGAQAPVLETFEENVDYADTSLAQINDDLMPVGNPLDQAQKDLWAAWLDGGSVQGEVVEEEPADGEDESEADPAEEETEDENDCAVDDTTPKPVSDSDLLNEPAVEACHDEGVIYDRNAKECGTALIDTSFACDRAGITKAFKDAGLNPDSVLDQSLGDANDADDLGDGYQIDQCGETDTGMPIVILVKVLEPPETPGLKVRVIAVE